MRSSNSSRAAPTAAAAAGAEASVAEADAADGAAAGGDGESGPSAPDAPASDALAPEVARRCNYAIIAHPDAGKTTLTEKMLLYGGALREAGEIKGKGADKATKSDWMDIEQQRGISVTASALMFEVRVCARRARASRASRASCASCASRAGCASGASVCVG